MGWLKHAAASLVGAIIATGAIYAIVPAAEQGYAIAIVAILAYLLGVKMPTPQNAEAGRAKEK